MELSQLQYFVETTKHRNFSEAAEALFITQSAISKSISKLEGELGTALFDRCGKSLCLTSEGELFLDWCTKAMLALDSGVRAVRDVESISGNVRIGVSEAIFIRHLIREFLMEYEQVSLYSYLMAQEQISDELSSGRIDFAISRGPVSGPEIVWKPLYNEHLAALFHPNHPFATRKMLRLEDLSKETFIIGDITHNMKSLLYRLCYDAGFTPRIRYAGHEADVATLLMDMKHSVMVVYRSTTLGVISDNIGFEPPLISKAIPVSVPIRDIPNLHSVGIAIRSGRYQSIAAKIFHDRVASWYRSLT
jgi:DNA-binding transcriptional LysR family regulator